MSDVQREMTLEEWVASLPEPHLAKKELAALKQEMEALRLVHLEARELIGEADATGVIPQPNIDALRSLLWRASLKGEQANGILKERDREIAELRAEVQQLRDQFNNLNGEILNLEEANREGLAELTRLQQDNERLAALVEALRAHADEGP